MKIIFLTIILLFCIELLATEDIPKSVLDQHKKGASHILTNLDTQFTFIGSLKSIADNPHLNVHGKEWAVVFKVEELLLGKYEEKEVTIGFPDLENIGFKKNQNYYITVDWGNHGFLLMGSKVVN